MSFSPAHPPLIMPRSSNKENAINITMRSSRHRIPSTRFAEAANNAKDATQVKHLKVRLAKVRAKKRATTRNSRAIVECSRDSKEVRQLKGASIIFSLCAVLRLTFLSKSPPR